MDFVPRVVQQNDVATYLFDVLERCRTQSQGSAAIMKWLWDNTLTYIVAP